MLIVVQQNQKLWVMALKLIRNSYSLYYSNFKEELYLFQILVNVLPNEYRIFVSTNSENKKKTSPNHYQGYSFDHSVETL